MDGWHLSDLAPGLYLALLGLLLARALRRWYDPVPGKAWLVFALVLCLLFAPALVGGKVLLPLQILLHYTPFQELAPPGGTGNRLQLDLIAQIAPALALERRLLRAGEWPLWNHLAGAGMPLMADPQSQSFQPLVLAAYPLPLEQAAAVTAGLRVLLALAFTFLFLRRLGAGEAPALAGALAFGLGGFLLLWLGWPIATTAALFPALLYGLVLADERGARRDCLLLGAALLTLLLGGQPETIVDALLAAAAFGLARLAARDRERGRLLLRWAATGAVAACLAAPVLLPAADYLPQTHRDVRVERRNLRVRAESPLSGWQTAEERRKSLLGIAQRALPAAAPNSFGNNRFGPYWGHFNVNEDAAAFAGTAALLAALLACAPGRRRLRHERFFLVLAAVCLAIVVRPPGLPQLFVRLPLLAKSATFHQRTVLFLGFSLAVLGAATLERWRGGEVRRRATFVLAAALAGLIAWAYLGLGRPPAPYSAEALQGLRLASLAIQILTLAAAAALLAGRHAPWRVGAFLALIAGELLFVHGPANPAMPRRLYFPEAPPVRFLQTRQASPDDRRMAGLGPGTFQPNVAALYGLADARYTNPLKPYAMALATRPVSRSLQEINDYFVQSEHPLYDLLGVRHLMTPRRTSLARPWRRVFRHASGWVWERPGALPRLFLPRAAERVPAAGWRSGRWQAWIAANPDFAALSLVESRAGRSGRWQGAAAGDLALLRLEPAHLAARVRLPGPRPLASSLYQDGGWRLLVDGRPFPTVRTNGPFLGGWLPAGDARIDLVYRPRTLLPGCLLAALGLAGAVAALAPYRRRRP